MIFGNLKNAQNLLSIALLLACAASCTLLILDWRAPTHGVSLLAPAITARPPYTPGPDSDVLDHVIPSLELKEYASLDDAIQAIARGGHCDITVHWEDVDSSKMPAPSEAFRAPHHNITVRQALNQLLGNTTIGYTVADNVIVVQSTDQAWNAMVKIYNVRDILDEAMRARQMRDPSDPLAAAGETVDILDRLLKDCVATESWRDNGGRVGVMMEMMGLLVISQTPENHKAIGDLLDDLRRTSHIDPLRYYAADAVNSMQMDGTRPIDSADAALSRALPSLPQEPPETFQEAINVLRETAGCEVLVEWRRISAAGIGPDTPVDLPWPLRGMTLRDAIKLILQSAGDSVQLGVTFNHGVIVVTTMDGLQNYEVSTGYNISDLLRTLSPQSSTREGGGKSPMNEAEAVDKITTALVHDIDPDSWRENGGSLGTLDEIMGVLFVRQTPENQRAVEEMLQHMREATDHAR